MRKISTFFAFLIACGMASLVLLPPNGANAQCASRPGAVCSTPVTSSYTSHHAATKKVVVEKHVEVAPIAVPVLVPSTIFQYLPAIAPPVAAVPVPAAVAPVAAAPAAATVAPAPVAAAAAAPSTAQIDKLIRERLEAIIKEKVTAARSNEEGEPPPLDSDEPVENVDVGAKPAAAQTKDVVIRGVNAAYVHCAPCHNERKQDGDVQLFDGRAYKPLKDGVALSNAAVAAPVSAGKMPKLRAQLGNKAMSPEDKNDLLAWLTSK